MKLNEKIFLLRKKSGLSQEELADKLDISRQAVYKWEAGTSLPEIEKIKFLAKFFNVSTEYLINDELDTYEEVKKEEKKVYVPRPNFYTGKTIDYNQKDIDNGYAKNRKSKIKADINYYTSRHAVMERNIKSAGGSQIFVIQPETTIALFQDMGKQLFGFYYGDQIQFVCPIENYVDMTFGGGVQSLYNTSKTRVGLGFNSSGISSVGAMRAPTVEVDQDTEAWAVISYISGGAIKHLKLEFTVNSKLTVLKEAKKVEQAQAMWRFHMDALQENLHVLKAKLDALKIQGEKIRSGEIEVRKADYSIYKQKNEAFKKEHDAYVSMITESAKKDNRKQLGKDIAIFGILGGVILAVVIIVIKSLL